MENDSDVYYIDKLVCSNVSVRQIRWVLAVAKNSGIKYIKALASKHIATEMINFTNRSASTARTGAAPTCSGDTFPNRPAIVRLEDAELAE